MKKQVMRQTIKQTIKHATGNGNILRAILLQAIGAVTKTPDSMSECFFSCQFRVLWAEFDSIWQSQPVAQAPILAVADAAFWSPGCRLSILGALDYAESRRITPSRAEFLACR